MKKISAILSLVALVGNAFADPTATLHVKYYTDTSSTITGDKGIRVHFSVPQDGVPYQLNTGWGDIPALGSPVVVGRQIAGWIDNGGPDSPATFNVTVSPAINGVTAYGTETFVYDYQGGQAGHGDNADHSAWVEAFYGSGGAGNPYATKPTDRTAGGNTCFQLTENGPLICLDCGMPQYSVQELLVSLHLTDTPLSYRPAFGPPINFTVNYSHRDVQPAVPDTAAANGFSNFGPQWTCNWLSYVTDDPDDPTQATVYVRGGGSEIYAGYDDGTLTYTRDAQSQALLIRSTDHSYEKQFPDGYRYLYTQSDNSAAYPRRIFLTAVIDPQGNEVDLAYDTNNRLQTITDATGKVTNLQYGQAPAWYYRVTKVVDPFGRSASFQYYPDGRLQSITDAVNLTSSVAYEAGDNFISTLTTPYGVTQFAHGENGTERWVETTDPLGSQERVEYREYAPGIANTDATPAGFFDEHLDIRNTFFWDKKAYAFKNDYTKARLTHWLQSPVDGTTAGIVENIKPALENRVWYGYDGQTASCLVGTSDRPTQIVRLLNNGTPQVTQFTYNSLGNVTSFTDPAGRSTSYSYQANGIDLNQVQQVTGGGNALLLTLDNYVGHQPQTITDAAGKTTQVAYNAHGQASSITNAKGEVTQYFYDTTPADPAFGKITSVTRAPGVASFEKTTYYGYIDANQPADNYGRLKTITDSQGYTVTLAYDAIGGDLTKTLDRVTRVTYPDATYQESRYDNAGWPLDVAHFRDRLGHETAMEYDALRHQVKVTDPQGRVTQFVYCACGALDGITDPAGNQTVWTRDLERRIISKTIAGQFVASYTYEADTGRLSTVTDALNQVTTYGYYADNRPASVQYTNAVKPTANVSYAYDPVFPRITSMIDGTGETDYGYYPIAAGTLGAGQLETVSRNPVDSTTITYSYDELGRRNGRSINAAANSSTVAYDVLGRVDSTAGYTNPLGTFLPSYVSNTDRLSQLQVSDGTTTRLLSTYTWKPNLQDQRLDTITYLDTAGQPQSQHSYSYDAEGEILSWQTVVAGTTAQYSFGYNTSNELETAVQTVPSTQTVLHSFSYNYDSAGNRVAATEDGQFTSYPANAENQLTSSGGSGPMQFRGTVSKPSTVTLAGQPATMDGLNWSGWANVSPGANSLSLSATETNPVAGANAQTTTRHIALNLLAGVARNFVYDNNGSMTDNGAGQTYEWDAANRLTAINYTGTNLRTEFTYDGLDRRVAIYEKNNGTVTSERHFVWDGLSIAEERDASGNVTKQFYPNGEVRGTLKLYYSRDHLGSIRDVTDGSGVLRARYDYTPWGQRSVNAVAGINAIECDFGFTGHFYHSSSQLHLAPYRAYAADLGRWLSRDPIEEEGGVNLYGYAANNSVEFLDPLGLVVPGTGVPHPNAPNLAQATQMAYFSGEAALIGGGAVLVGTEYGVAYAAAAIGEGIGWLAYGQSAQTAAVNKMKPTPNAGAHCTIKRDSNGNITNYEEWDAGGNPVKRVDVVGRDHDGVPTPHVHEYAPPNVNPATGKVYPGSEVNIRPALPFEIP